MRGRPHQPAQSPILTCCARTVRALPLSLLLTLSFSLFLSAYLQIFDRHSHIIVCVFTVSEIRQFVAMVAWTLWQCLYLCLLQLDFTCSAIPQTSTCLQSWIVNILQSHKSLLFLGTAYLEHVPQWKVSGRKCQSQMRRRPDTAHSSRCYLLRGYTATGCRDPAVNMVILPHTGPICRPVNCPHEPIERNDFFKKYRVHKGILCKSRLG